MLGLTTGALLAPLLAPHADASAQTYRVRPGDTLWGIALSFGTTVDALQRANALSNPDRLAIGQTVLVAAPQGAGPSRFGAGASYVVQRGDTLWGIALRLGVTPATLAASMGLPNPDHLIAGQTLVLGGVVVEAGTGTTGASSGVGGGSAGLLSALSTYRVRRGDTLSGLAQQLGVTPATLAAANGITDVNHLVVGQTLTVGGPAVPLLGTTPSLTTPAAAPTPGAAGVYVVQAGDTLSAIALRQGVPVATLAGTNNITNARLLRPGQVVRLTAAAPPAAETATTRTPPQGEVWASKATVRRLLETQAAASGVDAPLVKALAWQESGWQMVTASDGGMGVMQLMPDTVAWLTQSVLRTAINPFNPADNIRAGVALLRYHLRTFAGDTRLALAAYHQGQASVQARGLLPETEHYVANILSLRGRFTP